MKKLFFLFFAGIFFIGIRHAAAQDPYVRLKQAAAQRTLQRETLAQVAISETDRRRRVITKTPVAFRPFEMKDKDGRNIDPNETIMVNGKSVKAKEVFDKLNEIEKEQNARGYSIREKRPLVVEIVTPPSSLDGNVRNVSKSISRLKTETELESLTATTKQVGNVVLKLDNKYTTAEKQKLLENVFSADASGVLSVSAAKPKTLFEKNLLKNTFGKPSAPANTKTNPIKGATGVTSSNHNLTTSAGTQPANSGTPLKVINETSTKDWSFGVDSTLRAGFKVDLIRYAKIYKFNPQSPGKSMSEFKVSCNAKVYGAVFSHTLNFLSAGLEFYAPSDSSKQMTAKGSLSAVGVTILSLNESLTQSKNFSNFSGTHYDKNFGITVPICCGVSFSGLIGVKGDVGINYNGGVYRTVVKLSATPVIDLKGYAEGGLQVGIVKCGAGAELTFIKAQAPLYGLVGIWTQDASQVVVGYSYYVGYDLSMLSGRIYGFADICVPVLGCTRVGEVDFFHWNGYKSSGTIADGTTSYVINF